MKRWVVEIQPGCWLAKGNGDPCRTLHRGCAQRFATEAAAKGALTRAKRDYPRRGYKLASIYEVLAR